MGGFDRLYTRQEMIEHYDTHQTQFATAGQTLREVIYPHKVLIELDGDDVEILHTRIGKAYASNWPHGNKALTDSIFNRLQLSEADFKAIQQSLSSVDCIGYSNFRDEDDFSYKRAAMGMYTYLMFPRPLPDSLIEVYNDSCRYNLYTPRVVFEYGGGAFGPQCFGDYFYTQQR